MTQAKKILIIGGGFGGHTICPDCLCLKKCQVITSWMTDLLFKQDLTFIGSIKNKSLTKVDIKSNTPSIKDFFKDYKIKFFEPISYCDCHSTYHL